MGFHEVFANAVDENLVFIKHPFAIRKTLCQHFARVQIIFVMCISDYLFDRRDYYSWPIKKRKKENILCNLTSTKTQNESKQLCTQFMVLPHDFECVHAPAGKRFEAHLILTATALRIGEFTIKEMLCCCCFFLSL